MKRVYLSAMFKMKDKIKKYSEELAELGIEPTSSWVGENAKPDVQFSELPAFYLRDTAIIDIKDMFNADTFVLFVPSDEELESVPKRSLSRGGRNWETGFFYALMMLSSLLPPHIRHKKEMIIVGQRESVFHFLYDLPPFEVVKGFPLFTVKQFLTWEEARNYLTKGETHLNVRSEEVSQTSEATQ